MLLYALLLFPVSVNHIARGLTVGKRHAIKLKAWPRIGILVNQMRWLLDAQLMRCFANGTVLGERENSVLQYGTQLNTQYPGTWNCRFFADSRQAYVQGEVAKALFASAKEVLASPPDVVTTGVIGAKL